MALTAGNEAIERAAVPSAARETRADCCITRIFRGTMPQKVPLQEKWEQFQKWQEKGDHKAA
ncbi:hypothetical protein MY494_11755 [Synechococcus sp. A10-1-5-1]|uniref:hypothetical protein n=1 Tax=Synechococcus sp. A10-1-5-1 TaxID=2936507 RepID=UPI00200129C2|nr:hypothetical protein [Synechococcus sp. A10-1-5-1]UPM49972.1 hypothetical protein MY494_11755 [Synechococcus sp. A10-1-5-1]